MDRIEDLELVLSILFFGIAAMLFTAGVCRRFVLVETYQNQTTECDRSA